MQNAPPLVVREITKRFRQSRRESRTDGNARTVTALSSVSIGVSRGEIYGLLGPNGSGKSTLVRIVSTLLLPDAGCAAVFGLDVVREPAMVRQLINRVSVEASFFKQLSPAENLLYTARLYGMAPEEAMRRAREMLEQVGFPLKRMNDPMEELSRGQLYRSDDRRTAREPFPAVSPASRACWSSQWRGPSTYAEGPLTLASEQSARGALFAPGTATAGAIPGRSPPLCKHR